MCFLAMISFFSYGFRLSWNFEWYNRCRHEVCWALVIDCNPHSFPPTKVEIEVEPQNPVVGSVANLKCKSDSSSPEVKMIWYRNNEFLSGAADARSGSGNYGGQGWILWQKLKNWHFKFGSIWFTNVELIDLCTDFYNQLSFIFNKQNIHLWWRCYDKQRPADKSDGGWHQRSVQMRGGAYVLLQEHL